MLPAEPQSPSAWAETHSHGSSRSREKPVLYLPRVLLYCVTYRVHVDTDRFDRFVRILNFYMEVCLNTTISPPHPKYNDCAFYL